MLKIWTLCSGYLLVAAGIIFFQLNASMRHLSASPWVQDGRNVKTAVLFRNHASREAVAECAKQSLALVLCDIFVQYARSRDHESLSQSPILR